VDLFGELANLREKIWVSMLMKTSTLRLRIKILQLTQSE